jgi:tetratricopeptide (TPR) repeat protein
MEAEVWSVAMLQGEYGRFLRKQGDLVSARKYLELAVESEDGYQSALASSELVTVLLKLGEPAKALEVARETFSLAEYNEDERMKNKAAFGISKALLGMGNAEAALKEIDALDLERFTSVKHKVRFDLIRAEALAGLEREEEALKIYARAIPALRKLKLWDTLGQALADRAFLHYEMDNMLDCEEDTAASLEAYVKAENDERISSARLLMAGLLAKKGDWAGVEHLTGLVVDNVLQMFASWYPTALGLCALAKAKLGKSVEALVLADRLFENKHLVPSVAGNGYHAQAIAIGGVKGKNLAVKAMKSYLAGGEVALATEVSALA